MSKIQRIYIARLNRIVIDSAAKGEISNIKEISKKIDNVARTVLTKVLVTDSAIFLEKKFDIAITEYFNDIIFQKPK